MKKIIIVQTLYSGDEFSVRNVGVVGRTISGTKYFRINCFIFGIDKVSIICEIIPGLKKFEDGFSATAGRETTDKM
jgi:hypothetical protein